MTDEHKFYEDFEIGESFVTAGRTITETDIVMHAMHTGDFMPHHTPYSGSSFTLMILDLNSRDSRIVLLDLLRLYLVRLLLSRHKHLCR